MGIVNKSTGINWMLPDFIAGTMIKALHMPQSTYLLKWISSIFTAGNRFIVAYFSSGKKEGT